MTTTTWNKLVRDRIPEIIMEAGETPVTRILEPEEFVDALKDKVIEEAHEAAMASPETLTLELADLLEVVDALVQAVGLDATEIAALRQQRAASRGRFAERIFLVATHRAG